MQLKLELLKKGALVHFVTTNGKGGKHDLWKRIDKLYPYAKSKYLTYCQNNKIELGTILPIKIGTDFYILNVFVVKNDDTLSLINFEQAWSKIRLWCNKYNLTPYMQMYHYFSNRMRNQILQDILKRACPGCVIIRPINKHKKQKDNKDVS